MRKITTILLALLLVAVMPLTAFASQTTELTTTVPAATYTLIVPASQTVTYGSTETSIGSVSVENAANFASGKNLIVTINYTPFTSESVSTTIPYVLNFNALYVGTADHEVHSGGTISFSGTSDGGLENNYGSAYITMKSSDWGKALAGEYRSVITFTSEVVVSE